MAKRRRTDRTLVIRTRHVVGRGAARPLRVEPLEDRRLMAAAELGSFFGAQTPFEPSHDAPEHDHLADGGLSAHIERTAVHRIRGENHLISWEPAGPDVSAAAEVFQATGLLAAATFSPITSIPVLNSLVGAAATIYLDFNGHFEATWGGYSNLTTPVYDADGDRTTFSDAELGFIYDIWERVAEDFTPFNVNVSTVEPPTLAPGASAAAANGKALRVAIGGVGADWYGSNIGGVAYINSYTSTVPNVAYVFADGSTSTAWMSDTSSHEAGHAFGLLHQSSYDAAGVKTLEYNTGTTDWVPLMGTGANLNKLSTWHNGTNASGPTTFQDDMAVIGRAENIFGFRADDRANTISGATPLAATPTGGWSGAGSIGANSDVDWFSFDVSASRSLRISVSGPTQVGNLDAVLELRDAAGNLLGTSNPSGAFDATLTRYLSGRNYVGVRSNGVYGRIGQYTVNIEESAAAVTVSYSGSPFTTSESGRSESATIVLESRPTADVVFAIASNDETEGVVSTGALVFTSDNWFIPQTVTVTGVADGVADGAQSYIVSIAAAASADLAYHDQFDPGDLTIVNLDPAPGHVYWIRSNLTADLAVVDRSTLDGDVIHTALNVYDALGPPPASPGYYGPNRLTVDASGGKMYWTDTTNKTISSANLDGTAARIVLTLPNIASDIIVDSLRGKIYWSDGVLDKIQRANLDGSSVEDVIAVTPTTPGGQVTPSGLELDLVAGKLYWSDNTTYEIRRANLDGSGVEIVRAGDGVNLPQSITLDVPSGKIYYGLRQNFQTQQLYRANLDGSGEELLVDLNAVDPSTPNPVVQGIAIDSAGGRIIWSQSIGKRVFSADLDGGNVAVIFDGTTDLRGIAFVPATPGVTVTPTAGLATTEAGGTASFSIVLNTPPAAAVTIPLATSDATEGVVSTASVTFTPANWSIPQTVVVTGRNDVFADGDKTYAITLGPAASADLTYAGLDANDVPIVNRDDEMQTVTIANTTSATIPDRGTITSTINLASPGALLDLDIRVNISHGWNEDLDVTLIAPDGTRVELFTDVGGMSSNFTNTVLDDEATQSITASTAPFTGRYRPEGNLTSLEGKAAAGAWRLEVKDDARLIAGTLIDWAITARTVSGLPNPSAVVTPTAGLVTSEGGGTASFTVRLDAPPTANVTIPVSTSDATEGAPLVSYLTFTPTNWSAPQTVNVAGVDDAIVDGAVAYTIVLGAAASADPDFAGLNPADVSVTNSDNDSPTTKFYVVDDGSANRTYEYAAAGSAIENYTIGSANSAPRGAASTAAGDRVWVVDANRNVYVYNTSGSLLGAWTAGTLASNALPEDITVHGTDVWILDRQADRVYRYTGGATRLSGSQTAASSFALNSSNGSAKGMVTDGASIWVVDDGSTNRVFKYTTTGSPLGSWSIASANSTPTGITIDPTNVSDVWIVDSGTDRVYQYTAAAGRTSGSQNAAASFALSSGNSNPQGIADPPSGAKALNDGLVGSIRSERRFTMSPLLESVRVITQRTSRPVRERYFEATAATGVVSRRYVENLQSDRRDSEGDDFACIAPQGEVNAEDLDLAFSKFWQ